MTEFEPARPPTDAWTRKYIATVSLAMTAAKAMLVLAGVAFAAGVIGSGAYVWISRPDGAGGFQGGDGWWTVIATAAQPLVVAMLATGLLLFTAAYLRLQVLRWETHMLDDEMSGGLPEARPA